MIALAPYGERKSVDRILERLIDLKPDGSFRMDMSYFNYCQGLTMTSRRFERLFGGPPRTPESPLTEREMDMAASIQKVTEEILLRMARHVHNDVGLPRLCLAGGVALNCVANGRILREGPYDTIWIQPAAGDAGGARGSGGDAGAVVAGAGGRAAGGGALAGGGERAAAGRPASRIGRLGPRVAAGAFRRAGGTAVRARLPGGGHR